MGGWGEAHDAGAGSTGQIELAHHLLDQLGSERGPLAVRVATLAKQLASAGAMAKSEVAYDWAERRFYVEGAPAGKCYVVREMFSYGDELERFIPHLLAMGQGLENPRFKEYDRPDGAGYNDEDNYGNFVVGLRPLTPEDKTEAQHRAEQKKRDELELLATLKAKYEPDEAASVSIE